MLKKTSNTYYYHLDFIRFFVVFFVLLHHWVSETPFKFLPFASTVAFVLSAFLLTKGLLEEKNLISTNTKSNWIVIKAYFWRRSLRIFPIYYLLIIVAYLINWKGEFKSHSVYYFTFLQNFDMVRNSYSGVGIVHTWSIAVQEQFYLVLPFIVLFLSKKVIKYPFLIMVIVGILSRSYYFFMQYPFRYNHFLTECTLDCFGIGGIIAILYIYYPKKFKKFLKKEIYFYLVLIIYILSFILFTMNSNVDIYKSGFYTALELKNRVLVEQHNNFYRVLERLFIPLLSIWLIGWGMFDMYSHVWNTIFKNRTILYLSKISYGIYLYHFPVFLILRKILIYFKYNEHGFFAISTYFIFTILISSFSYYFFEKPIMDWNKNREARKAEKIYSKECEAV
ncbi:peptidoglycan/LPS O-acetylase OafA/YrhL [Arcicella aurantiaca]|uniref:Peptidoglycan/LPS O-acetylase OafA/YrhL n=1 Tax=Arcicella aurantiaca TaxID=591202 RepID=A0A316E9L1_9BACT|nr:acyltransferase [Arcicella aurantiaca]PWK26659.1 peptidoglycan/LPS O-acetylase OafA/YrhL [Arcicella aurantiaca]